MKNKYVKFCMVNMHRLFVSLLFFLSMISIAQAADVRGVVQTMWINQDTNQLWFTVAGPNSDTLSAACQSNWIGLTMYVPMSDPNYAYYYSMLLTSEIKNISVYIANISIYSNSAACDITKTGYGLVLLNVQ